MVSISPTINFDLSRVTYFKDKGSQIDQAKAKAVEQLSHAEMVTVVTGFIDKLIQSGVEELATAAKNGSNTEAQGHLDKYRTDTTTVASFKGKVADELAKNIYAVQHLLIKNNLANPDGTEVKFKKKDDVLGQDIVFESVQELAEQTLASIHTKLSAYGIKVNAEEAAQLKKVIIEELKKPPKPKSETPEVTPPVVTGTTSDASQSDKTATASENTPAENSNTSIINDLKEQQNKLAKQLIAIPEIQTFLNQKADQNQESGMSQLRELNQKIKERGKDWDKNLDTVTGALKSFQDNLAENVKFIADHLRKETFISAFETLDNNKKIQVGILLKNLETTVDETTMVGLTGKITGQLGEKAKESLRTKLGGLIEQQNQSEKLANPFALNLNKANEYLEKYNGALKEIKNKNLPTQKKIAEKQKATDEFLGQIQESLDDKTLSIEDVKVINKSLGLTEEQRKSGKASPAIDNICGRFIDSMKEKGKELGIDITEEGLKQFAGTAVVLAIGAALFCPNLVGNLTKGAFSLGAMITQTVLPLYQNITQANLTKTLAESANK